MSKPKRKFNRAGQHQLYDAVPADLSILKRHFRKTISTPTSSSWNRILSTGLPARTMGKLCREINGASIDIDGTTYTFRLNYEEHTESVHHPVATERRLRHGDRADFDDASLVQSYLDICRFPTTSPVEWRDNFELKQARWDELREKPLGNDEACSNNDALIAILIARSLQERRDPTAARRLLDALIGNPRRLAPIIAYAELGDQRYTQDEPNQFELAKAAFTEAKGRLSELRQLTSESDDHILLFEVVLSIWIGNTLINLGDAAAEQHYLAAIGAAQSLLSPNQARPWVIEAAHEYLAKLHANHGDVLVTDESKWEQALAEYNSSIKHQQLMTISHRFPGAWFNSAFILVSRQEHIHQALSRVQAGLEILNVEPDKKEAAYYHTASVVFHANELSDQAINHLKEAIRLAGRLEEKAEYRQLLTGLEEQYGIQ